MWFRLASIFAAGLALSGCAGDMGSIMGFGGGGYPAETYTYAYSGPYAEYGSVLPSYGYEPGYVAPYAVPPTFVSPFVYEQPGWGGRHWRHDRDWIKARLDPPMAKILPGEREINIGFPQGQASQVSFPIDRARMPGIRRGVRRCKEALGIQD